MKEVKHLKDYGVIEELIKEQDMKGLCNFISDRMKELLFLLQEIVSKIKTDEEYEALESQMISYAMKYKEKDLEEMGADLTTLLCLLEML